VLKHLSFLKSQAALMGSLMKTYIGFCALAYHNLNVTRQIFLITVQSVWNNSVGESKAQILCSCVIWLSRKWNKETMHVVPDLSSSCTGIVSDIVRCRQCVWYGCTWRFGNWLYTSSERLRRVHVRHTLAACLSVRLSAFVTAASQKTDFFVRF